MRPTAGPHRLVTLTALFIVWTAAQAGAGTTERVSVSSQAGQADLFSDLPAISRNGRVVVFRSAATNLVPDDTNNATDIFVHDRKTDTTSRVSVDSAGTEANAGSEEPPSISGNGRLVAFSSGSSNLVPGDTNSVDDIFVHDRKTGITTRVSVDSAGNQANGRSYAPAVSKSGRFIAFESNASNLVPGDTNGNAEVFLHDRKTGKTTRVSVDSAGAQANGNSEAPSISASGRFVVFSSGATNLVPNDSNGSFDVFRHDRKTGKTIRVSLDSGGNQADSDNYFPSLSANGRHIAFESFATNLVAGDSNGKYDVFHRDLKKGVTSRVSVGASGAQGSQNSLYAAISANGRWIAFESDASNLVGDDTNLATDSFLHDRKKGITSRVSVDSAGTQGNGNSARPAISGKGRHVVFQSISNNLAPDDTNAQQDVFIHKVR